MVTTLSSLSFTTKIESHLCICVLELLYLPVMLCSGPEKLLLRIVIENALKILLNFLKKIQLQQKK